MIIQFAIDCEIFVYNNLWIQSATIPETNKEKKNKEREKKTTENFDTIRRNKCTVLISASASVVMSEKKKNIGEIQDCSRQAKQINNNKKKTQQLRTVECGKAKVKKKYTRNGMNKCA